MTVSLHTATVGVYRQILGQVAHMLEKAEGYCAEHEVPPVTLLDARLAPDMWNFSKQVMCAVQHSQGAVEAMRTGLTGPDMTDPPTDFATLRGVVANALEVLDGAKPEEIDGAATRDIRYEFTIGKLEFNGEDYLLSFALPNFFFHATSAYAVLRNQGVPVGKRDFLGWTRARR